jgi:hypothetical protein
LTEPPQNPAKNREKLIEKMFEKYLDQLIVFMRKYCPEPVKTVDNNICQSLQALGVKKIVMV